MEVSVALIINQTAACFVSVVLFNTFTDVLAPAFIVHTQNPKIDVSERKSDYSSKQIAGLTTVVFPFYVAEDTSFRAACFTLNY